MAQMNPYRILGVGFKAGDKEIRQAYLAAVRSSPPEADPVRFNEINQAYETIRNQTRRHRHELVNQECYGDSPIDALVRCARIKSPPPLSLEEMREYLRRCLE